MHTECIVIVSYIPSFDEILTNCLLQICMFFIVGNLQSNIAIPVYSKTAETNWTTQIQNKLNLLSPNNFKIVLYIAFQINV